MKLLLASIFLISAAYAQKHEALKLWQKRDDAASLEQALVKFEAAHAKDAQDLDVIMYLARGNFIMAEYHNTSEANKMKLFEKGRNWGIKGMETNAEFKKARENGSIEKAAGTLTEKEVPFMFWTAASTGKWARLNGIMSSLKYKGESLALMNQVEKLKPDFFYGSVPRYWGSFYAVAPGIAGGDMGKSKKNFKKALEMAPDYLGTRRLFAELYWVKEEDEKEFEKELKTVIDAPIADNELAPENRMEKKVAQELLNKKKDLF